MKAHIKRLIAEAQQRPSAHKTSVIQHSVSPKPIKTNIKTLVRQLAAEGNSAQRISYELGIGLSTVHYHLSDTAQEKSKIRNQNRRDSKPGLKKLEAFMTAEKPAVETKSKPVRLNKLLAEKSIKFQKRISSDGTGRTHDSKLPQTFGYKTLMEKLAKNPVCYLTGRQIDLNNPSSYAFDHIHPTSRGGSNSMENLGLTCKMANQAKSSMTVQEFVQLCGDVLGNFGFVEGNLKEWLER